LSWATFTFMKVLIQAQPTTRNIATDQYQIICRRRNKNFTQQCRLLDLPKFGQNIDYRVLVVLSLLIQKLSHAHNARFLQKSGHDSISMNCRGEKVTDDAQRLVAFSIMVLFPKHHEHVMFHTKKLNYKIS